MEHRWSTRKAVTGSVVIECPRIGLIHATMHDISLGGMRIETETKLPVNAPVAVVFDLPSTARSDAYCLQAMVVRRTPRGGMGLMFLEPDPQVVRSMRSTLYDERSTNGWHSAGASGQERAQNALHMRQMRDK